MYLVYKPSGDSVYLGKRMAWGWYGTPSDVAAQIANLFDRAQDAALDLDASQDDFALAMEDSDDAEFAIQYRRKP
jgi:hypothetical protein